MENFDPSVYMAPVPPSRPKRLMDDPSRTGLVKRLRRAGYSDGEIERLIQQETKREKSRAPKDAAPGYRPSFHFRASDKVTPPRSPWAESFGDSGGFDDFIANFKQHLQKLGAVMPTALPGEQRLADVDPRFAPEGGGQYVPPNVSGAIPQSPPVPGQASSVTVPLPPQPGANIPPIPQPSALPPEPIGPLAPPVAAPVAAPPATPLPIAAQDAPANAPVPSLGLPPSVAPPPQPQMQAPIAPIMPKDITPQTPGQQSDFFQRLMNPEARSPLVDIGLRLMSASQPNRGMVRGPTFFEALGNAGIGFLGDTDKRRSAKASSALEAAKLDLEKTKAEESRKLREAVIKLQALQAQIGNSLNAQRNQIQLGESHRKALKDLRESFDYLGAEPAEQRRMERELRNQYYGSNASQREDAPLDMPIDRANRKINRSALSPGKTYRMPNGDLYLWTGKGFSAVR